MINEQQFVATLAGLQELLPLGKTLSEPALVLAWALFPLQAKTELAPAHLLYAVQQRVLDPEPAREQAITQQLLRYLYPLADGMPALDRGLRSDLAQRMAAPERFHALSVPRPETTAVAELQAQRLLPPSSPQGAVEAICQVSRPLLLAARAVQDTNPGEPSPFSEGQLALSGLDRAAAPPRHLERRGGDRRGIPALSAGSPRRPLDRGLLRSGVAAAGNGLTTPRGSRAHPGGPQNPVQPGIQPL